MESSTQGDNRKKDIKDENEMNTYIQYLEDRIRDLESKKQSIEAERLSLEQKIHGLRNELDHLKEAPLITGTILDVLDEENDRIVVNTSSGPDYIVKACENIKKEKLFAGMNVALNQHTLAIMEILPPKIDPFVRGMEMIDSVPDIDYNDIGGLGDQIVEVRETVELPLLKPELFKKIGIDPPKGVLLYGPPGTGKTLLAKAVAHETKATFIRIIGSELVQKFIGEGARYVREIFNLARKKAPTILFIDELDAIAAERMEDATSGDTEVQRTLMQLLSELDGFKERGDVKIIGATNRIDILDTALLRPGRFDRLIEFPIPDEKARESIFKVHMKSLNVEQNINLSELVKASENATGADIKAICTEAGMFAIRKNAEIITPDDFKSAVNKVLKKESRKISSSNLFL